MSDALVDFTGGVAEVISLENVYKTDDVNRKKELFKTMAAEIEDHALMCCAIKVAIVFVQTQPPACLTFLSLPT